MKIGVLGPKGSFSEKAVRQWDKDARIVFYDTISDVIEAVSLGKIDAGIVPIENSLEGSINLTLDLLREDTPPIIGEVIVRVKHCFLFKNRREDITMIYSHPQALAQCRKYIKNTFPGIKIYETTSTADAAKKASFAKHIAAIASEEAAFEYRLNIFARDIQDVNENYTRFIIIGKNAPLPSGNDKTSIIVYVENKPGALNKVIYKFARAKIDLTKIESRPSKKGLGNYLFYIDLKGHADEKIIKNTLNKIRKKVRRLQVLGSYPAAKLNGEV